MSRKTFLIIILLLLILKSSSAATLSWGNGTLDNNVWINDGKFYFNLTSTNPNRKLYVKLYNSSGYNIVTAFCDTPPCYNLEGWFWYNNTGDEFTITGTSNDTSDTWAPNLTIKSIVGVISMGAKTTSIPPIGDSSWSYNLTDQLAYIQDDYANRMQFSSTSSLGAFLYINYTPYMKSYDILKWLYINGSFEGQSFGGFTCRVYLYNFTYNTWTVIDSRQCTLTSGQYWISVNITSNPQHFIGPDKKIIVGYGGIDSVNSENIYVHYIQLKLDYGSDTQYPQYSNPSVQYPTTYNPGFTNFTVTFTDDMGMSNVYVETNITGTWQNYTMSGGPNYQYQVQVPAGTFSYRFIGIDVSGKQNATNYATFTINKATPSLSIGPLTSVTYGTATQTGCQRISGDSSSTLTLYRNGTQVAQSTSSPINETSIVLAAGTYNYTCTITETQNYTSSSLTNQYRTINKATPILTTSVTSPITYGTPSNYVGSESNTGDGGCNYILLRNGTQIATGSSVSDNTVLGAGTYNYTYYTTGCQNYTANSDTKLLTVNKATPPLSIQFNNSLVTYGTSEWENNFVYLNYSARNPLGWLVYRNNVLIENTSGLVLRIAMDEGSGSIAYDSSGYNNHGTLYNNPVWVDGKFGKALNFNGSIKYVSVPDSNSIRANEITISAWVNLFVLNSDNIIMNKRHSLTAYAFRSYYLNIAPNNTVRFTISTNTTNSTNLYSSSTLTDNVWYHITAVYNGTAMKIYINGILDSQVSKNGTIVYDSNSLRIGSFDGSNGLFNGIIDEIRIYNRTLSDEEIKQLYFMGSNKLGAGNYSYILNVSGTQNYTSNSVSSTLTINKSTPTLTLYLNGSTTATSFTEGNINITSVTDVLNNLTIYLNVNRTGWVTQSGIKKVENTLYYSPAVYNVTTYMYESENYTSGSSTKMMTITTSNVNPRIDDVYNQSDNIYQYGKSYSFNATVCDENGNSDITQVIFEFNNANSTVTNNQTINSTCLKFMTTKTDLAAGTYNYKWYVKDSAGAWNYTSAIYTVNKATPTLTLSASPSWTVTYPTLTTVTGSETNNGDSDLTYNLYRNNVLVSNPETKELGAGNYNYVFNTTGGQNYTSNSVSGTLTVNKATPSLSIQFNNSLVTYSTPEWENNFVYLNYSAQNPLGWLVYRNNTLIENTSGLVLRIAMDEGSGSIAYDSSGYNNHGTLYNGTTWTDGKFGKALSFDGVDDYVLSNLSHSNSITFSAWIKYFSLPSLNSGVFQVQPTNSNNDPTKVVGIWVYNNGYLWGRLIQSNGTIRNFPQNKYISPNTWYHVVLTADNTTGIGKEWVNGVEVGNVTYDGTLAPFSYAKIGRQGNESWHGIIDEVRIYNRALSDEEIKQLYLMGANKLGAGTYNYVLNVSETQNYTSNSVSNTLTINKGTPTLNLFINETPSNFTITWLQTVTIKGNESNIGDTDVSYCLYNSTSQVGCGSSFLINYPAKTFSNYSSPYRFVYNTSGGANWTFANSQIYYLFVNKDWNQTNNIKTDEEYEYDLNKKGIPILTKIININPYNSSVEVSKPLFVYYNISINNTNNNTGLTTTFTNVYANFTRYINLSVWQNTSSMENTFSSLAFNSQQYFIVNVSNITAYETSYSCSPTIYQSWKKYDCNFLVYVIEDDVTKNLPVIYYIDYSKLPEWNNRDRTATNWYVDGTTRGVSYEEIESSSKIKFVVDTSHSSSSLDEGQHNFEVIYYIPFTAGGSGGGGGGGAIPQTPQPNVSFEIFPVEITILANPGEKKLIAPYGGENTFSIKNLGIDPIFIKIEKTGDYKDWVTTTAITQYQVYYQQPEYIAIDPGKEKFVDFYTNIPFDAKAGSYQIIINFVERDSKVYQTAKINLLVGGPIAILGKLEKLLFYPLSFSPNYNFAITKEGIYIRGLKEMSIPIGWLIIILSLAVPYFVTSYILRIKGIKTKNKYKVFIALTSSVLIFIMVVFIIVM
jgi:hypothetical protein